MMGDFCFARLPQALLPWFRENRRQLPWRQDREPYHVWVSEIMLQQTRVEAVKGYYQRFLDRLPTICALADCDPELLHKLWEGLGYYSRVRNLQKAAQMIMKEYDGLFPQDYSQIRRLPGIGDYTAGAICSICFDAPTPAVDGNVLRVAARLTADPEPIDLPAHKERIRCALKPIYPAGECGDFTQALMELGATICLPNGQPHCNRCPCESFCQARARGMPLDFPVRLPKRQRRMEDKTVFFLRCGDLVALEKRPDTGLLAGLWQFPNVPGLLDTQQALAQVEAFGLRLRNLNRQVERSHIFTHVQWRMRCFYVEVAAAEGAFVWMNLSQLDTEAALPTAFRMFWEEEKHV